MNGTLRVSLLAFAGGIGSMLAAGPVARAAEPEHVPGSIIVKYADATSAEERRDLRETVGLARQAAVPGTGAEVVQVQGEVEATVRRLERSSRVEFAEPNYIYRATATPDDPRFGGEQYGLDRIDAPEGWDALGLGTFPAAGGAPIGVIDTGALTAHEDLAGRVTECGGVKSFGLTLLILQLFADPRIVEGVAFSSPLVVCKALNGQGAGSLQMVANCIDWVVAKGAKVVSMSLGGPAGAQTLKAAAQRATQNGALVVAAAGNGGDDAVSFPAGYEEVVSVGATDRDDRRAAFSQVNPDVEISAPGAEVVGAWNSGSYRVASGTSASTPFVSGAAALIAGRDPSGGPAAWRTRLQASVDDLGAPGRDPEFGFGRLNLAKAATP